MFTTTGGRFEGEGTYACTFTPSPKCKNDNTRISEVRNDLGKVFHTKEDMDEEWDYAQRMHRVDPTHEYLIYPTTKCEVLKSEIFKDPTSFHCSFLRKKKNKFFHMLKMSHGGVTMDYMFESTVPPHANVMVDIMKSALQAVRLLSKHHLIHNDLKFNNIVYNPDTMKTKLIDFGLVLTYDDAFNIHSNQFANTTSNYWLHPPEYRILPYVQRNIVLTKEQIRQLFKSETRILDLYFTDVYPTPLIDIIHDKMYSYCEHEDLFIRYVSRLMNKHDASSYMKKYANKIDIYSLGISCLHIWQYAKHENQSQRMKVLQVIKTMIHPDPMKRPTINKLIKMLDSAKA